MDVDFNGFLAMKRLLRFVLPGLLLLLPLTAAARPMATSPSI